jgi:hypothetical protein
MNQLKLALEKIVQASDVSLNSGKSMQQIHELATTALSNYKEGKRYSDGQMRVAMLRVVKEFSKTPREGRMSFSELMNDVIQSLSPKKGKKLNSGLTVQPPHTYAISMAAKDPMFTTTREGKEEVNSSVYDFPNKKICFKACEQSVVESGNCQCFNQRHFEKFSLFPESSNPIATDHTSLEPNQTEAEKGSLRKIANEIMDKEYSFFTPDTRKKMVLSFCNGYSLDRTTTIQEIEDWAKENTESVENQSGDRGGAIWTSELLTYLQNLKK